MQLSVEFMLKILLEHELVPEMVIEEVSPRATRHRNIFLERLKGKKKPPSISSQVKKYGLDYTSVPSLSSLEFEKILKKEDSSQELNFFKALFKEMLSLFTSPFNADTFDFGSDEFWAKITDLSQRYSKDEQIRKMNGNRGSKHFLYINRTFFGLYNLLHDLKAQVDVNNFRKYID